MEYEPVIGLEVHAELATKTKMFCGCLVVDSTQAEPNISVCPVCAGMPGALPVANQKAVEYALRVALALECEISPTSIFARKNYFYPDLPKGYQISQYEQPLARHGRLSILSSRGEYVIRIRRVHLEEDTGKLTHIKRGEETYSLIDLNRAGVPLLEIVSEPDLHSAEDVRLYATMLRAILRYLGVNSGDLQKGVMRVEPNVSVRPLGSQELGTRVEIKNLNSFRALERSVAYEIQRQSKALERGEKVAQETRGWDESQGATFVQRRKEAEDDYRYFPEPDLPPLVVETAWVERARAALPELPTAKQQRFRSQYGLNAYDAGVLTTEPLVADYFEETLRAAPEVPAKIVSNWISGDLFALLNQAEMSIEQAKVPPHMLAQLVRMVHLGEINQNTGKMILADMFLTGKTAEEIARDRGLRQISDAGAIAGLVQRVLSENPGQVTAYLAGKEALSGWFFGQVMRLAQSRANPRLVQDELNKQLKDLKDKGNM